MDYHAKIDDEALAYGKKLHRGQCAVVVAIAKQYPDLRHIRVDQNEIRLSNIRTGERECYQTTLDLAQFLDAFDRGEEIDPESVPPIHLVRRTRKWAKPRKQRSYRDIPQPKVVATPKKKEATTESWTARPIRQT